MRTDTEQRLRALETRQNPRPHKVAANVMAPLTLQQIRGYWPVSSADENFTLYDVTAQGRHLTKDGVPFNWMHNEKIPFVWYDGTAWHYRLDEAGLRATSQLTIGLWVIPDSTAGNPALLVKDDGVNQDYGLDIVGGAFRFYVYAPTLFSVTSTATLTAGSCYFVVGRFVLGQEPLIFVNGVVTTSGATVGNPIVPSAASLFLGSRNGANPLSGKVTWAFMAAMGTIGNGYPTDDSQLRQMYDSAKSAFGVYA